MLIKLVFSRQVVEKSSNIKFNDIRPVAAELFQQQRMTDGRNHKTNIIVPFRNFLNAPKNRIFFKLSQTPAKCSYLQPDYSNPRPSSLFIISILILSPISMGLLRGIFPSGILTKIVYAFLFTPYASHDPPNSA